MEMVVILVGLLLFVLIPTALWIWAIIDILKSEFTDSNKVIWLLIVILVPLLGMILYAFLGRAQKISPVTSGQTGEKFCQSCGEKMPVMTSVCPNCNAPQPVLRNSSNTVAIVLALSLVIFVGIGAIGILAAIAIPQFASYRAKSYESVAQSDLKNIKTCLEAYYADHQRYPASIKELPCAKTTEGVELVVRQLDKDNYVIITGHKNGKKWYLANNEATTIYSAPRDDEEAEFQPM